MNVSPILITGTSGHLGNKVIRKVATHHNVISISRHPLPDNSDKNIHKLSVDLLNYDQFSNNLINYTSIPTIIHIAGVTDTNGHGNFKDNIVIANNIVKIAKQKNTNHIIFISSNSVNYSDRPYAHSKKISEEIISESGIPFTILRPTMLLDPGSPEIKKIIKILTKSSIIPMINSGSQLIQPIFTNDLVNLIELCLNNKKSINKIYTVGGASAVSSKTLIYSVLPVSRDHKLAINIPLGIINLLIWLFKILKIENISDQLSVLTKDITVDNSPVTKELLWKPTPMDTVFNDYFS
ncbi:MAG TPA: NAD(P)-dependent oxidoreductase [Patescibacteria group bacterium]